MLARKTPGGFPVPRYVNDRKRFTHAIAPFGLSTLLPTNLRLTPRFSNALEQKLSTGYFILVKREKRFYCALVQYR
jgi:hypothetical protein